MRATIFVGSITMTERRPCVSPPSCQSRLWCGRENRTLMVFATRGILSPVRLPFAIPAKWTKTARDFWLRPITLNIRAPRILAYAATSQKTRRCESSASTNSAIRRAEAGFSDFTARRPPVRTAPRRGMSVGVLGFPAGPMAAPRSRTSSIERRNASARESFAPRLVDGTLPVVRRRALTVSTGHFETSNARAPAKKNPRRESRHRFAAFAVGAPGCTPKG